MLKQFFPWLAGSLRLTGAFEKHAFADIYSLPKRWRDTRRAKEVSKSLLTFALVCVGLATIEFIFWQLAAQQQAWIGKPVFLHLYNPFRIFTVIAWLWSHSAQYPVAVGNLMRHVAGFVAVGSSASYAGYRVLRGQLEKLAPLGYDTQGSARVLETAEDLRGNPQGKAVLENTGGYLGYVPSAQGPMYVRGNAEHHTLIVAPTGSGKTTAYCYQLLTTHSGSIFAFDLKGENWTKTAGFRAKYFGSQCLRLSLSDATPGNAHLNPLDFIRKDTEMEYQDVEDILEVVMDPDGKGDDNKNSMSEGYFLTHAKSAINGAIYHVIHGEPPTRRNLSFITDLFTADPSQADDPSHIFKRFFETDENGIRMVPGPDGLKIAACAHPMVYKSLAPILALSPEAQQSVIGTVMRYLRPYQNPLVRKATAYSDFNPSVLLRKNISLYLVVSAGSKDALKPVTRLIINLISKRLTEALPKGNFHRLHLLLDEFNSLGKVPAIASKLDYFRGYGVTVSIILQGFNQLIATWGAGETISMACNTLLLFTPGPTDEKTAEMISKRMGKFTYRAKKYSNGKAEKGALPYDEFSRRMLDPDEVPKIPENRALIFFKGLDPIYAFKEFTHDSKMFKWRIEVPPPFDAPEQTIATLRNSTPETDPSRAYEFEHATPQEIEDYNRLLEAA